MDLSRVITGPVVTEKAERLKASARQSYTFRVSNAATKVDVKNALKFLYNATAETVRIVKIQPTQHQKNK
jgi:ribosomal protein L23